MTEDIRKSVTVPLDSKAAFDLYFKRMADWWPLESHSMSAHDDKPARTVKVDLKVGGNITELTHDDREEVWGTITALTSGRSLSYDWYVGRPREEATKVVIAFSDVPEGCRIDLTHTGFEVLGAEAQTMAKRYDTGWNMVLGQCFAQAARSLVPTV